MVGMRALRASGLAVLERVCGNVYFGQQ
jgi:hypothetical protein